MKKKLLISVAFLIFSVVLAENQPFIQKGQVPYVPFVDQELVNAQERARRGASMPRVEARARAQQEKDYVEALMRARTLTRMANMERVANLRAKGYSIPRIVKETGLSRQEVERIIRAREHLRDFSRLLQLY